MLWLTKKIDFSGRSGDAVNSIVGIVKKRALAPVKWIVNALKWFAKPFRDDAIKWSIADALTLSSVVAPGDLRPAVKWLPGKFGFK